MRRGNGFEARSPHARRCYGSWLMKAYWPRCKANWNGYNMQGDSFLKATRKRRTEIWNTPLLRRPRGRYVEVVACPTPVRTEQDALDLVALCGEHDTNRLMIHAEALSEEFIRLRTGVAGAVLQKLVNYSVRTAVLLPDASAMRGKFRDMAAEAGRGSQFRIFTSRQDTEDWLLK